MAPLGVVQIGRSLNRKRNINEFKYIILLWLRVILLSLNCDSKKNVVFMEGGEAILGSEEPRLLAVRHSSSMSSRSGGKGGRKPVAHATGFFFVI
jgi:hypothetical protein